MLKDDGVSKSFILRKALDAYMDHMVRERKRGRKKRFELAGIKLDGAPDVQNTVRSKRRIGINPEIDSVYNRVYMKNTVREIKP